MNAERTVYHCWFSKTCVAAAWLGLALAAITPPHGTGFTVCWIKSATGLPCPGCGLTRSLSCALRGMFVESWNYHPMGVLILLLFLLTALISLLPAHSRQTVAATLESHRKVLNGFYVLFATAFVSFGSLRMIFSLSHLFR